MANTYDRQAAERRVNAYIEFLMAAYDTDAHGLADLAGIKRGTLTRFINRAHGDRDVTTLFTLAQMTGISMAFLLGEEQEPEAV